MQVMGMVKNGVSQETPPIQSLDRGLVILEAVAKSSSPVSLSDLTGLLGIDRSSVYRLANTLKRRGFLAYPAGRKDYILGPALWRLSHLYDWGTMLIRVSREHLKQLAGDTNETAHLAIRESKHALFIDHAAANHVIAVSGQTGESVPLYCTAHGKALLAALAKLAIGRDCARVEWSVLNWNEPSIQFYKNLGAVPFKQWQIFRLTGPALTQLAAAPDR